MLPCLRDHLHFKPLFGLLPIEPFGILVLIGVVVGYHLGKRRARLTGLDAELCADGMYWTAATGFVVAHLVSVIFYFPHRIRENPLVLLAVWSGLSSFGGFLGGILGAYYFFVIRHRVSLLKYADAIIFGLVPGWVFGRMGCTAVHDHPGLPTRFVLGVACGAVPRHDLGLYELLFTLVLTALLYGLRHVRPFHGFHPALILALYAPVRFLFDYLRTADVRYGGLTPGQYFAVGILGFAVLLVAYGVRLRRRGDAPGLPAAESSTTAG
ncbi:MAG: prolipoprotein diacylglyceryl transferase [Deltaproteobacteria bacterium]|nr:prolipoprotein diacylglyceryl transferase [Deltaproteobacteria bacterium]